MASSFLRSALLATHASTLGISVTAQPAAALLDTVTVSAKAAPLLDADKADVGGFGAALARIPQSISVLGADLIGDSAVQSLSGLLKLDASLNDNYTTSGYI
ncbi:MAG: hypothetical protein ACR2I0_15515, partial [Rhodoferax sp.]